MHIVVDEKCMPADPDDDARAILSGICDAHGYTFEFADVRPELGGESGAAIEGLGVASVSLVIGLLSLLASTPRREISRVELLGEVQGFLHAQSLARYAFSLEDGFEHLEALDGRPCVVGVFPPSGEKAFIYIGTDGQKIVAALAAYDPQQFF